MNANDFDTALAAYLAKLNATLGAQHGYVYTTELGGRVYVRIVRTSIGRGQDRSVHTFVERSTGLIWKAASWKAPAKNFARGSIYEQVAQ